MKTNIYKVEGIHCLDCIPEIENILLDVPEVKGASVDTELHIVYVESEKDIPLEHLNTSLRKKNYILTSYENRHPLKKRIKVMVTIIGVLVVVLLVFLVVFSS